MTFLENQSWPAPSNPKPILIVGAGGIVRDAHMPAYQKANLPVIGAVDLDIQRANALKSDFDLEYSYTNLSDAVLRHENDVVYDIAVPPNAIASILRQLPDKATVLIQKPMGSNLVEAREIREICREKQLVSSVNFQLRYSPMMLAVQNAVKRQELGKLLEVEVHLNIYTPWNLFPFLIPMERVEMAVHSIHYLDSIRAIAGTPTAAFARSMRDPRANDFAQTRTSVILDYDSELRGLMSINHNHQCGRKFQSAWMRVEGTKAAMMVKLGVCFDYPNGEADELWFCENGKDWVQIPLEGSWFIDSFMGSMRNLQRFSAGEDSTLKSSTEDAFHTMALVEACFDSIKMPAVPLVRD
ncbi:Gfo/Idh/MocA family oxidoreductase [Rhodobacteraceae bacterium]|nr:Gfo/Idh/MocA family oxidoreductase [Paracoccaceae bacterium]